MVEGNWLSGLLMAASYQRIEDLQAIGGEKVGGEVKG